MISEERINAQNRINALANEIEGHLTRILSRWVGSKGRLLSGYGGFAKKLRLELEQYEESHGYNMAADDREWSLICHAQCTSIVATLRNLKTREKVEMYIAKFDEDTGVILCAYDCHKRRTDYTLEGVQNNIKKARELEEQARQLRSEVRDFSIR